MTLINDHLQIFKAFDDMCCNRDKNAVFALLALAESTWQVEVNKPVILHFANLIME